MAILNVAMMLCDWAAIYDRRLIVSGASTSTVAMMTVEPYAKPHAVAIVFSIPFENSNAPFSYRLALVDSQSNPVNDAHAQPIAADGVISGVVDPAMPVGTPLAACASILFPQLPLQRGARYSYVLSVRDEETEWRLDFAVLT